MYTIYLIRQDEVPVYVGMTKEKLSRRLAKHYNNYFRDTRYDRKYYGALYVAMHKIGREHFTIEPIMTNILSQRFALKTEKFWTDYYNEKYGLYNKYTADGSKKIYCQELDKIFLSSHEAERATGVQHGSIARACAGKAKSAGGYHWNYVDETSV